jgi:hypothetical protein
VDSFRVKVVGNKLYIDPTPINLGTRQYKPHVAYANLQQSVRNYLADKDKDCSVSLDAKIHVLGISTTNTNDDIAPRKSTSEESLKFALDYAKINLMRIVP